MARRLGHEYNKGGQGAFGNELINDAKSIIEQMSKNATVDRDGVWNGGGLVQVDGSYLYANNRFFIPWGWYANPVGATSSTGWAVFNDFDYNPFVIGGGYNSTFYHQQCHDNPPDEDTLQKLAKFYDYEYTKPLW